MVDVALAIENILLGSKYDGSTTDDTEEQYDDLEWKDSRITKPTWVEIVASWNTIKDIPAPKTVKERLDALEVEALDIKDRLTEVEAKEAAEL
jgi:hypothetical protein